MALGVATSVSRLKMARLIGATCTNLLGLTAIHMPKGYLGGIDQITEIGMIYSAVALFLTLLSIYGFYRVKPWANVLALITLSLNIGFYAPSLASDAILGGLILSWQLTVLASFIFQVGARETIDPRLIDETETQKYRWIGRFGPAIRHLSAVAMVDTVAVVGFEISHHTIPTVICLVLHGLTLMASIPFFLGILKEQRRFIPILAAPLVMAFFFLGNVSLFLSWLAVFQISVIGFLSARNPIVMDVIRHFFSSPALFVVFSFLLVIGIGTLLLSFPAASAKGVPIAPIDALFTAVSAVCVTGLIVLDTPNDFSLFGQMVIISLVQLGGLGIMVLSTFATILLGASLGLRGEKALRDMLELPGAKSAYRLVYFIMISTFSIEAVGAVALTFSFLGQGSHITEAIWKGVFHSISAFCNAGFSLQSDSLMMFRNDPLTLFVFASLVFFGSIGFVVMATLWFRLQSRSRRPYPVHVKVVLWMTAFLSITATLGILTVEWDATLAGLGFWDKITNAFFQAVVLRTAGFNSIVFTEVTSASVAFMVIFMFIGGAPGSTAGGIKVTTAGILLAAIPAMGRGEGRIHLFGRRIAQQAVFRATAIMVVTLTTISVILFLLLATQDMSYEDLLFEVTSAVGTVGLSLGITPALDSIGKYLIIFAMFLGRIGPLTAALALGQRPSLKTQLPEENLMVG